MKPVRIRPNFAIPKHYRRIFMLFFDKAGKNRCLIDVNRRGIMTATMGNDPGGRSRSRCLDWMQECLEFVGNYILDSPKRGGINEG